MHTKFTLAFNMNSNDHKEKIVKTREILTENNFFLDDFFFMPISKETWYEIQTKIENALKVHYDLRVKCDEENNTPEIIQNNELVIEIFDNDCRLVMFQITPKGIEFSEYYS